MHFYVYGVCILNTKFSPTCSKQITTPSTHHIHASLHQASLRTYYRYFKTKDFNHNPLLTYIYITQIILTEIIILIIIK